MDSSSDELKSDGAKQFNKQKKAPTHISIRLDKHWNHTKEQNLKAKKAFVKDDIAEGLAERLHEALTLQEELREFKLHGPDDDSSIDSGYPSSEDELSDSDYRPHSQESFNSVDFFDGDDYYNSDDSLSSSGENSEKVTREKDTKESQLCLSDHNLTGEKDIRKEKSCKNYFSHQKDNQEQVQKKLLTFTFSGLSKKSGYHSNKIPNISRLEKHTLAAYQEASKPIEVAEQPKERVRGYYKK